MCACVHVLDCVFGNSENVQTVYEVCKGNACMCACVHVLDCVFGNSENVQTVYEVCKLMYCA